MRAFSYSFFAFAFRFSPLEKEMEFSLVVFDLDGTLLTSKETVSDRTVQVVREIASTGTRVALCSGRTEVTMKPAVDRLGIELFLISMNGAVATKPNPEGEGQIPFFEHYIATEVVEKLINYTEQTHRLMNLYDGDLVRVKPLHEGHHQLIQQYLDINTAEFSYIQDYRAYATAPYNKILIMGNDPETILSELQAIISPTEANLIIGEFFVEVIPANVHKGTGLRALCEDLHIPLEKTLVFGDGPNDLEFLQTAGYSIAMANAVPEAKAKAKKVADFDNDHDGVAVELEKFLQQGAFKSTITSA